MVYLSTKTYKDFFKNEISSKNKKKKKKALSSFINPLGADPTKCQTHLSAVDDKSFESVWPFYGVGA